MIARIMLIKASMPHYRNNILKDQRNGSQKTTNLIFNKYNKGEDFLILSELHKCDEFQTQIFFAK